MPWEEKTNKPKSLVFGYRRRKHDLLSVALELLLANVTAEVSVIIVDLDRMLFRAVHAKSTNITLADLVVGLAIDSIRFGQAVLGLLRIRRDPSVLLRGCLGSGR